MKVRDIITHEDREEFAAQMICLEERIMQSSHWMCPWNWSDYETTDDCVTSPSMLATEFYIDHQSAITESLDREEAEYNESMRVIEEELKLEYELMDKS